MLAKTADHPLRNRAWGSWAGLAMFFIPWVLLPLALMIWAAILAPWLPALEHFIKAATEGGVQASFGLVLIDLIGSYLTLWYFLRRYKSGRRDLGLRRFSWGKALLTLVILAIGFFMLIGLIYFLVQLLVPGFNPDQAQTNEFTQAAPQFKLYSFLALVVLPPLVEEPVFRGFIFPAFAKRWGLVGGAIISSLLFGFAHLQANVSVYTFVIGLVLCFMYVRLGSIIPGIGLHMLNNYLAYQAISQIK